MAVGVEALVMCALNYMKEKTKYYFQLVVRNLFLAALSYPDKTKKNLSQTLRKNNNKRKF